MYIILTLWAIWKRISDAGPWLDISSTYLFVNWQLHQLKYVLILMLLFITWLTKWYAPLSADEMVVGKIFNGQNILASILIFVFNNWFFTTGWRGQRGISTTATSKTATRKLRGINLFRVQSSAIPFLVSFFSLWMSLQRKWISLFAQRRIADYKFFGE